MSGLILAAPFKSMLKNMELQKINFKNIPVQAGIISRIISLDVDSNNCFQELEDLISSDQALHRWC